ncbi:MAG: ATP-binding protein [Bacteroidota bacterium]
MKTLSYHILDIVQNSINAGADLIEIAISENDQKGLFTIIIEDNGKGMDRETLRKAIDPYFSTRKERNVGLGLSLLKQNTERTGGKFTMDSTPGEGTRVQAEFVKHHIDCPAIGDLAGTIHQIIVSNPGKDFVYRHNKNSVGFEIDSRQIKEVLDHLPLYHPEISQYIDEMIRENLNELREEADTINEFP